MYHLRHDIAQLQRLYDAIAITMDAIRRIGVTSTESSSNASAPAPWIPAPATEQRISANSPRFEHSAWQPAWPTQPPAQPFAQPPAWSEWQRDTTQAGWSGWPTQAWPVAPWWSPFRPY